MPSERLGLVANTQRFSLDDGPGIRTTVFLKGCDLRCLWCHNPECIGVEAQVQFDAGSCGGCGQCAAVCPQNALIGDARSGKIKLLRERCAACGACAKVCPSAALSMAGERIAAGELVRTLLHDVPFYQKTGGGVTFSGGEPLMQIGFCVEALHLLREHGVHTAIDTAGLVEWSAFEQALPLTELFLFDIKAADERLHRRLTQRGNDAILRNFKRLCERGARVWVRIPLVKGLNDSESEIESMIALIRNNKNVERVELLPYHKYGEGKYALLGMEYGGKELSAPDEQALEAIVRRFAKAGVNAFARQQQI